MGCPDFDDIDKRVAFWERLLRAVRARTLDEWRALFDTDPDVWAEMFSKDNEVLDHPQMRWNQMILALDDPERGVVVQPAPVVRLDPNPASIRRGAPRLGEHDADLRTEAASSASARVPPVSSRGSVVAGSPLDGVTVLELGTYYAAPYGATLLADLGARVIKLEQLDGDPHRNMLPFPEVAGIAALQAAGVIVT